jgi:Mg2+/citrate symporter
MKGIFLGFFNHLNFCLLLIALSLAFLLSLLIKPVFVALIFDFGGAEIYQQADFEI